MLPMVQRIWFGPVENPANEGMPDLNRRELVVLLPLVLMMLLLGTYPKPFLERSEVTVLQLIETVEAKRGAALSSPLGAVTQP
jgi:NADH-quinone oxidoreductase subunit M